MPRLIPSPKALKPQDLEVVRVLGKIDVVEQEGGTRLTSLRVFEARVKSSALGLNMDSGLSVRCFVKEYLQPAGEAFGRRELATTRKLTTLWNKAQNSSGGIGIAEPPFSTLLGQLRTDERIDNAEFKTRWSQRFPRSAPPVAGNLWLIFNWDEATLRSLKTYPALPQANDPPLAGFLGLLTSAIGSGSKRGSGSNGGSSSRGWAFLRLVMRSSLEALDFLHRSGFCHNSVSAESMWLTTTNNLDVDVERGRGVSVRLTDLGSAQRLKALGPTDARNAVFEDYYMCGLVLLETIVATLSEGEDAAAVKARLKYLLKGPDGEELGLVERISLSSTQGQGARKGPLTHREWARIFELHCQCDFQTMRDVVRDVSPKASALLEANEGEGFRLLFRLLARGRLVTSLDDASLVPITGRGLVREFKHFLLSTP